MAHRMHYLLSVIEIDVGMLEEAQAELELQYSSYRPVHECHGNSAFLHALNQRAHIRRFVRDVQVNACLQRQNPRFFLCRNNSFINEGPESLTFTGDDSLEAEFLS